MKASNSKLILAATLILSICVQIQHAHSKRDVAAKQCLEPDRFKWCPFFACIGDCMLMQHLGFCFIPVDKCRSKIPDSTEKGRILKQCLEGFDIETDEDAEQKSANCWSSIKMKTFSFDEIDYCQWLEKRRTTTELPMVPFDKSPTKHNNNNNSNNKRKKMIKSNV